MLIHVRPHSHQSARSMKSLHAYASTHLKKGYSLSRNLNLLPTRKRISMNCLKQGRFSPLARRHIVRFGHAFTLFAPWFIGLSSDDDGNWHFGHRQRLPTRCFVDEKEKVSVRVDRTARFSDMNGWDGVKWLWMMTAYPISSSKHTEWNRRMGI